MRPRKERCIRGHASWGIDKRGQRYCIDCTRSSTKRGRPKVTHCKRGHEIAVYGRYKDGSCRGCILVDKTKDYQPVSVPVGAVPVAPLKAVVERRGINVRSFGQMVADSTGLQAKSVERMLHRAIACGYMSVRVADDFCVAIGLHPIEVFGDAWFTYGAKEVADAV